VTVKSLRHHFVSAISDGTDQTQVQPQTEWDDDHDFWLGYRAVTGTSDTIAHADHFSVITYSNASAISAGIPAPSGNNFPLGWRVRLRNLGPGAVTLSGTGGATINTATSVTINSGNTLDLHSTGAANYVGAPILAASPFSIGVSFQKFWPNGTYTYTPVANLICAIVETIGAGGGGGGAEAYATYTNIGGGGGSGSYSRKLLTGAQIGASQTVTVGAGGSGGGYGTNSTDGGDTSFGTLCIGKGGKGGPTCSTAGWQTLTNAAGGDPGVGDLCFAGGPGSAFMIFAMLATNAPYAITGGKGGDNFFGGGGVEQPFLTTQSTQNGNGGTGYGGGGGAGITCNQVTSTTWATGGVGAGGACFVTEFHS